jgi:nitroreductase
MDEKDRHGSPVEQLRPLIRVRQIRDFTPEPLTAEELDALTEVARWSGSSSNEQPWRFVAVTRPESIRGLADAYMPSSRALQTATAAIAIALPDESGKAVMRGYDDGRVSERILIGASLLGLGAAITWVWAEARPAVHEILGIPDGWFVRTIMAVGHPTDAARLPKSAPGTARKPREETVFEELWRG